MIAFENQIVQVYEAGSGHFIYEFIFYDNVFEHSKCGSHDLNAKDKERKRKQVEDLEKEFKKSGLTRPEFNLQKRKADTEKGEYVPEMPPYTKVIRTHFHKLNSE